jgi:uncharacterized protein YggL (DUF469 family)
LCFRVSIEFEPETAAESRQSFLNSWLELLLVRGLYAVAGPGGGQLKFAIGSEAFQPTESDRVAVRDWLAARPELSRWSVGDLEDPGSSL